MITPYTTLIIPYIRENISATPDIFTATEILMMVGGVLIGILTSKYLKLDSYQSDKLFVVSAISQGILIILLSYNSSMILYFIVMFLLGACLRHLTFHFQLFYKAKYLSKLSAKQNLILSVYRPYFQPFYMCYRRF